MSERMIGLVSRCPFCGKDNPLVIVTHELGMQFKEGTVDAIVVTGGDKDKAEWLISGTCVKCWDQMFEGNEE